ncbi:MAG: VOC family protein [Candidatus Poribacteria bacterium]|nr:VOC family protein [Candidatus Poribacteria bacterium]
MPSVYLHFNGNCREAFEFYRSVFGGEFTTLSAFREAPVDIPHISESDMDKIMHVSFPVHGDELMGSDLPESFGLLQGNNFAVNVSPETREEADALFAALSEGGSVRMPMSDAFWGAYFGACADKFGVIWYISCEDASS